MMWDVRVGDAIVCVDITQPVNTAFPPIGTLLKLGGVYRVKSVVPSKNCGPVIGIVGISPWFWTLGRFEPIVKATEEFTASIRAPLPVPANA